MKALFETRTAGHSCLRFRRSVLGGAILASLLAGGSIFGQGIYYPAPPTPVATVNYSATTVSSNKNLQFLQNKLATLYPGTSLATPPTSTQYSAAVTACVSDILNGLETGTGITLTTFSNESVAWNMGGILATTGAISQGIVQVDFTTNNNAAQAITDLNTVATALAISQPTLVNYTVQGIISAATTGAGAAQLAPGIPQLVVNAINQIPTDLAQVPLVVAAGQAGIIGANVPAMNKTTLYNTFIMAVLQSGSANNNPLMIQAVTQVLASQKVPTAVGSLQNILNTAVAALPAQNNLTLAALTNAALLAYVNVPATQANIAGYITSAPAFTGNTTYVGQVVDGFTQTTRANLDAALTSNHGYADAIAAGATARNAIAGATILQDALTLGVTGLATDPNPTNVVEEAMLGNGSGVTSAINGAINTSTHLPYGTNVTFDEVSFGAAAGSPLASIGTVIELIVLDSGASITTIPQATAQTIVKNGIDGAASVNNSAAFGDIVYKAETGARDTVNISGPLVTTAITEIQAQNGLPYLAAVAAQAAGGYVGTNRTVIQSAADTALAGNPTFLAAANQGMALVQQIQTSSATHFVDVLNAMNTAASPAVPANASGDAVRADLYAAVMADPNDADGNFAAALKEAVGNPNGLTSQGSPVTDGTLLVDADNAIRGLNPSFSSNLQIVDTVVTHIQDEALNVGTSGVGDIFAFVSHEIVADPSLARSIVIAATVTDPDHAHFVAEAAAYQSPTTVYSSVAAIFNYAQITNTKPLVLTNSTSFSGTVATGKTFPGNFGAVVDQPAAAAAITAALVDGLLQANQASPLSATAFQAALSNTVASAVAASVTENGSPLQGPINPFNNPGDTGKLFQQSNGSAWNGASPAYTTAAQARTVGAAGAITGYIAEVTQPGDTTISTVTQAVLTAAANAARPYALQIAQAAGQAFAWVSGFSGTPDTTTANNSNPVYAIANAMAAVVVQFASMSQLENAVAFGISQAEQNVIGAGALGLNATNLNAGNGSLVVAATGNPHNNFYIHSSGTGTPVTDIFNL